MRLITVPLRLLLFPFRLAAVSGRAGWYAGRVVGVSRAAFFGLGFAAGLLVASPKARRVALAGTRRAVVTVARSRTEPAAPEPAAPEPAAPEPAAPEPVVPEPVVVADLAMAAPHGVALADPVTVETEDPTGPVLPTD